MLKASCNEKKLNQDGTFWEEKKFETWNFLYWHKAGWARTKVYCSPWSMPESFGKVLSFLLILQLHIIGKVDNINTNLAST